MITQVNKNEVEIEIHPKQYSIFYQRPEDAKYILIRKGRRFGLTEGFTIFCVAECLSRQTPVLWIDTVYANIDRYIDRYFKPLLKDVDKTRWTWRQQKKELRFKAQDGLESWVDLRSIDRPENIEGFGYKYIIINEAGIVLKKYQVWAETLLPMLLDYPDSILFAGGTPKGKSDKKREEKTGNSYHLFYELASKGIKDSPSYNPKYHTYHFTTYDNPYLNKNEIAELEKEYSIPELKRQELYGEFIDETYEGLVKREWWQYYKERPQTFDRFIQSWDSAFEKGQVNDYSVCGTWIETKRGYYLIDVYKDRIQYPELKKQVVALYNKYKPQVVVFENKASGIPLIQEIQRETKIPVAKINPIKDKVTRLNYVLPMIENGDVFLPDPMHVQTAWLNDYLGELCGFPSDTEHDDQVDMTSQALSYFKKQEIRITRL